MLPEDLKNVVTDSKIKPTFDNIMSCLLPPREEGNMYTIDEIDSKLAGLDEGVLELQQANNKEFEDVLDDNRIQRILDLYKALHTTQLDLMHLQCSIARSKEESRKLTILRDNGLVKQYKSLREEERELAIMIRKEKFSPLRSYFESLTSALEMMVLDNKKSVSVSTSNYLLPFDWVVHHRSINLLRICSRAELDVQILELMYQSSYKFERFELNKLSSTADTSNYVSSKDLHVLRDMLEIVINGTEVRNWGEFLDNDFKLVEKEEGKLFYHVFTEIATCLTSIADTACGLFLDLHINYIEAHLTDGINIEKLNGSEGGSVPLLEEQVLPLYAFSPQDYITQIGQHLLTLRKQTQTYDDDDDDCCLSQILEKVMLSKFPNNPISGTKTVTEIILKLIARQCVVSFLGRASNSILSRLSTNGKRQLATDALYLDNVLEDLKLLSSDDPDVAKFKKLLNQ